MTNPSEVTPGSPRSHPAAPESPTPQVWPSLRAHDARALIRFLVDVLGFEETVVYGDGEVVEHAQLSWPEGGGVMLGTARDTPDDPWPLVPGSAGMYVVRTRWMPFTPDSVAADAEIVQDLQDTEYGSHTFAVRDPEGNRWSFGTYRGEPRAAAAG